MQVVWNQQRENNIDSIAMKLFLVKSTYFDVLKNLHPGFQNQYFRRFIMAEVMECRSESPDSALLFQSL